MFSIVPLADVTTAEKHDFGYRNMMFGNDSDLLRPLLFV